VLNGHPTERLPNTLNVSFPGHHGDEVLARLRRRCGVHGLCLSRGTSRNESRAPGDGRGGTDRPGRHSLQSRPDHDLAEVERVVELLTNRSLKKWYRLAQGDTMNFPSANEKWRNLSAVAAACFAAVGVGGSLYLSLGLGLRACPLCFYQRSFVMATLAVSSWGWPPTGRKRRYTASFHFPWQWPDGESRHSTSTWFSTALLNARRGCWGSGRRRPRVSILTLLSALSRPGVAERSGAVAGWRRGALSCGSIGLGLLLAWGSDCQFPAAASRPDSSLRSAKQLETCRPPYTGQQ
jgi:hypothetical protein